MIYIAIYLVGVVTSLFALHKWKEELDVDHYDDTDDIYLYDDWESNAQAFTAFSIMWPVFWGVKFIVLSWDLLVRLSGLIENKLNK